MKDLLVALDKRGWLMIGRILFLLIPILGAITMWYFYQDAL